MGAKSDYTQGIEKSNSTDANTNAKVDRNHVGSDETLPIYYDAEPSAQPPNYPNKQSTSPTELYSQRRADRKKRTLRERWNDFKERNFEAYVISEDRAGAASAAEWNVQGGRLGGGLATPYRRKGT
ncbi:unnamed protein product [Alternaria alternata]